MNVFQVSYDCADQRDGFVVQKELETLKIMNVQASSLVELQNMGIEVKDESMYRCGDLVQEKPVTDLSEKCWVGIACFMDLER